MEEPAFLVYQKWQQGENKDLIASHIGDKYQIPVSESLRFVSEILESLNTLVSPAFSCQPIDKIQHEIPFNIYSRRIYRFADAWFQFEFESEYLETLVHPLVAHWETERGDPNCFHIRLFSHDRKLYLKSDGQNMMDWNYDELHLLKGKVFMELLNKGYHKKEEDWMAVMHAASICKGDKCILVPGTSGSGKSTMTALLQAHGFLVLSDDFTPVDASSGNVYPFPLAVSIKKGALPVLQSFYPELASGTEYNFAAANKIVRYLYPPKNAYPGTKAYPVKAVVFVKYQKGIKLSMEELPKDVALQGLVTESWLSPLYRNAERFLDWFVSRPFYQLHYSDTQELVTTINRLFDDAL